VSLFKAASTVSLLTLASRVTGLVRDLLMATTFGAGPLTDAFTVAFRIPNLFRRLFAEGAFSQAFVPTLAATREKDGDDATRSLVNAVATVLAWALLALSVLGVLAAPLLVWAMASGLQQEPQGYQAAVVMTRIMFPYIAFMSMVALAAGVLNTWKRFAVPAATPVLLNLCMVGALWLAGWLGAPWFAARGLQPIYTLAVGVMLGGVLQLVVQIIALKQLGLLPSISVKWSLVQQAWAAPATQNIAKLMLPALLGVSVAQLSMLINTQIASHLAPGSVTWVYYADRLMEFPTALLGVALGVVLIPRLSAARAAQDTAQYSSLLDWGLRLVVLLSVPAAVALFIFAKPLVATLFHHGAFSDRDVVQVSLALASYGVGLLGLVAIKVLASGFYAAQDTRTPMLIALVVLAITQVLNYLLVPHLAHAALTLSISIGALINALWLLVGLIRRGSFQPLPGWGLFALQVVAATALMAVFLMWASSAAPWIELKSDAFKRIGLMALSIVAGAAIYFIALWAAGLKLRALLAHQKPSA
jgi:putative peptidoglycan lipid II flippase